ncbi:MAG: GNAT family N-acetyltransferase [Paludibacteraceae bacterium]|nr:GNAT family N-acetyltransferase [Paludibacteraceae bacterium]
MSISAKERRETPDSKMGVPGKDKYPLRNPHEIKSANNLINKGDITPEEKKALARKIRRRAKEEGMDTSKLHAANKVAGVTEQVPPMSDGTSLGNAPPRTMAPYYDEAGEQLAQRLAATSSQMSGVTPTAEEDELMSRMNQIGVAHSEAVGKRDMKAEPFLFAQKIVKEISAQVEKDSKPPTGNQNCQLCTWCAEARYRGINALPRPIYSPRDPALNIKGETIVMNPIKESFISQKDVIRKVRGNVDSRWYVHVNWKDSTGGHEFLVVNINDYAYLLDAQAGLLKELDESDSTHNYFRDINFKNSYMVRLDTRKFNAKLFNEMNDPANVIPWDPKKDVPYMRDQGMLGDVSSQYTMRAATDSDLEFVYQSELETVGENKNDPKVQKYIREDAKDSLGHTKIIVMDDTDIGVYQAYETNYYGLREGTRDWWYLAHIYIKPEYRNLGIGSDIIKNDIKSHEKILLQVMKSNTRARKLYESLGFVVDMENDHGGLVMRLDKSKPVQEGSDPTKLSDKLIPVKDYPYDTVYKGAMGEIKTNPLFVTPFKGIASIFAAHDAFVKKLHSMGHHSFNSAYDEWNWSAGELLEPLKTVHVKIHSYEGKTFEPFEIDAEGFLYTFDISNLKDKIYRYDWMDPDKEALVANYGEIEMPGAEKINIHYIVEPETTVQESSNVFESGHFSKYKDNVLGFNDDGMAVMKNCDCGGKISITMNGEPIYKCESCGKTYGCVPFQEGAAMDFKDDELLSVLKNSKYGVAYHDKLITNPSEQDYMNKWHCLSPNEFINVGGGVCYDFVEWESDYLKKHRIPFKKFHISHHIGFDKTDVGKDAATHSICVAIVNGKYMYIEGSSKKLAKAIGYVKEFNNIDELLDFAVKHTIHEPEQSKLIIIDYTNVDNLIGLNLFDYQNRIFSKGKVITSDFIQEGAIQDLKNGVNPYSDKMVFHVTPEKHADGQVWKPRVPDYLDPYNPEETGFEDNTTPRICFSTSIEGCLNGITVNLPRHNPDQFDKLYVYIPEKPWKEYKHKTNKELVNKKLVYDANVTREVWIMEPVRMKLYGVIRVDQVSNVKRKSVVPTSKGEKGDRNYFTYKWHWVVKPKVLAKATKFDYSPENVIADLCIDLKKFKYGLIKDGKLQTGNVSESDYNKYWVFHSGQEVDEAGGGNCYDMVEYEAGYLEAFGVAYKKYFMSFTDKKNKMLGTHTICVVPLNGKYIYIEQAFKRVTDEWGYERQKTFDKLNDIFDYVAECMADYERQSGNFGVWDYTSTKIDYGTPIKEFMQTIMSGKMIYDGEAGEVKQESFVIPARFSGK